MGLIAGLFEERAASFTVGQEPPSWFGRAIGAMDAWSGVTVTPEQAMTTSAVYACVNVIAQTVASLPLITYRRQKRGRERANDFYLYPLLHDLPNPEMTSYDVRQTMQGHLGLRGNAFAEIVPNGAGRVREIWPLRPDRMAMDRDASGNLVYIYTLPSKMGGGTKTFRKDQIWHIRGLSHNGLWGISPIGEAMQAVGIALAMEEFGGRFFGSGAQPGFWLKHPAKLDDKAYDRLRKGFENKNSGLTNAHRISILEEGMSVEKIGVAPEEAQFLESRKFQIRDIARFYRMQPHKIQDLDQATFSNIEHQAIEFVTDTIRPWLVAWEQSIYRDLLLESERKSYYAEHLVDGLLRGDTKSRYEAYGSGINAGWMVRNEARERENLNPIEGLDEPLTPMNMGSGNNQGQSEAKRDLAIFEPVLSDAIGRITKREGQDIAAATKKGGDLAQWAEGYYAELESYAVKQLEPVFRSIGEYLGASEGEADNHAFERGVILARKRCFEAKNAVQKGPEAVEKWRESMAETRESVVNWELNQVPWR
jgi:HK97 family phage portal protein